MEGAAPAGGAAFGIVLVALVLEGGLGAVAGAVLAAPERAAARAIDALAQRLNRAQRTPATRRARGALVLAVVVGLALAAGALLTLAGRALGAAPVVEAAALMLLLGAGRAGAALYRTARALADGDGPVAAEALRPIADALPDSRDARALARLTAESAGARLLDRAAGLAFFYVLFGLAGAFAYRAAVLAAAHGVRGTAWDGPFGASAARLAAALNLLPALAAGLLVAASSLFVPGARPAAGVAAMARLGVRAALLSTLGWPVAAAGGALGLALGGPARHAGAMVARPWVGGRTVNAGPAHAAAAFQLFAVACLLLALALALAALALG